MFAKSYFNYFNQLKKWNPPPHLPLVIQLIQRFHVLYHLSRITTFFKKIQTLFYARTYCRKSGTPFTMYTSSFLYVSTKFLNVFCLAGLVRFSFFPLSAVICTRSASGIAMKYSSDHRLKPLESFAPPRIRSGLSLETYSLKNTSGGGKVSSVFTEDFLLLAASGSRWPGHSDGSSSSETSAVIEQEPTTNKVRRLFIRVLELFMIQFSVINCLMSQTEENRKYTYHIVCKLQSQYVRVRFSHVNILV